METIKLYDDHPYETEFDATVVQVNEKNIVLDQTLFFPEEGGQCPDTGTINGVKVKDVQIKEGIITHTLKTSSFHKGDRVHGKISWDFRFSNMQNHSGEHIFSGCAHRRFGYDNVGFHLGKQEMTLDLNGPLTDAEIESLEKEVNEAIYKDVPIHCFYPSADDLAQMDYRSKKAIDGPVRIVEIEGYDVCACCAPHVRHTGEIGLCKVIASMNYKGGTRLSLLCGQRAFDYLKKDFDHLHEMYNLLSANQNSIVRFVSQLQEKNQLLESRLAKVERSALEAEVEMLDETGDMVLFQEDTDTHLQRDIVNEMMDKTSGKAGFFVGDDQRGYRFIIGSKNEDMLSFMEFLKDHGAKGGGQKEMITGFIKEKRKVIESYFNH